MLCKIVYIPLLPLEDGARRRIGGVDRRRDPPLLGRIRPSRGWISESLGSGGRFGAGVPWGRWSARHRELGPGSLGAGLPQLHGVAGEEEMAACYWCSRGGAPRIRLPWPDPTGHGSRGRKVASPPPLRRSKRRHRRSHRRPARPVGRSRAIGTSSSCFAVRSPYRASALSKRR
jgi:hypothetical protein